MNTINCKTVSLLLFNISTLHLIHRFSDYPSCFDHLFLSKSSRSGWLCTCKEKRFRDTGTRCWKRTENLLEHRTFDLNGNRLVGPYGLLWFCMLANLTYLIVKDYRYKLLFIVAILVGFIGLTLGQALIERVFALEMYQYDYRGVWVVLFFILLLQEAGQKLETLTNPFKNKIFCKTFRLKSILKKLTALIGPNPTGKINSPLHCE